MKRTTKLVWTAVVASALLGTSSAGAASFSEGALKTNDERLMTGLTTIAGAGDFDQKNGDALSSDFRSPFSILVQADGTIVVSDTRNHVIRKVSGGKVSTEAGPEAAVLKDSRGFPTGSLVDGKKNASFFQNPAGMAADAQGNLYLADAGNNAIRKVTNDGQVVTVAGNGIIGAQDGKGAAARFNMPQDVAIAADGNLYVADTLNHFIRKIQPDGTVSTLNAPSTRIVEAAKGQAIPAGDYKDGPLNQALFNEPSGLALDAKGNLYVSDTGNQRIRYIDLSTGTVTTVAGGGMSDDGKSVYNSKSLYVVGDFADGDAASALFNFPQGIAVTDDGGLLIADSLNHSIRRLRNGQVTTLAGNASQFSGEADGIEGSGELHKPTDVAVTADGKVVVADSFNNKLRLLSFFSLPSDMPEGDAPKVTYNGKWLAFPEQNPEISSGRLMVPVRSIAEAVGYQVDFTSQDSIRLIKQGSPTIEMALNANQVKKLQQGKETIVHTMDVAPYLKNEKTLVPIRFFVEEVGLDVQWDNDSRTAVLRGKTK